MTITEVLYTLREMRIRVDADDLNLLHALERHEGVKSWKIEQVGCKKCGTEQTAITPVNGCSCVECPGCHEYIELDVDSKPIY